MKKIMVDHEYETEGKKGSNKAFYCEMEID
jgi:hypothetical protein